MVKQLANTGIIGDLRLVREVLNLDAAGAEAEPRAESLRIELVPAEPVLTSCAVALIQRPESLNEHSLPEYQVGYRKPPQHSRFKNGQSGNPKGRPKRSES